MISGPQVSRTVRSGSIRNRRSKIGTTPTFPCQEASARSTVTNSSRPLSLPVVVFCREEKVGRLARSVEQDEPAVSVAFGQEGLDGQAKRGQAQPARDEHDVAAAGLDQRPATAVGAADPDHRARPQRLHGAGYPADGPDRVADRRPLVRGRPRPRSPPRRPPGDRAC